MIPEDVMIVTIIVNTTASTLSQQTPSTTKIHESFVKLKTSICLSTALQSFCWTLAAFSVS
jgi:hypothetical protein